MADSSHRTRSHELTGWVSFLLSQLGAQSARRFAERLAPLGVQPSQFGLLMLLRQREGQSQRQLADALGLHRNVMVGLVDELETRGLVERRRHPADRRAHAIHLTPAAHELLTRAVGIADEQDADLLAGLDADDRARLLALLQRLAESTGSRPGVHPGLGGHAGHAD